MGINKKLKGFVWVAGVAIPIVVGVLFVLPGMEVGPEMKAFLKKLPALNASLNGSALLCLLGSLWAIRRKNIALHQRLNTIALVLSAVFLLSYVSYHLTVESTKFCQQGWIRYVYFFVLISHILMSIAIVPMVLTTYILGLGSQIQKHRKWARITYPMWLYVTFTGVVNVT